MQWSLLKKGEEKTVFGTKEIESYVRDPFLCFYFLQQYCPCIRPNRLTEAKFFDPSSTNIYCGLRLEPRPDQQDLGQENRATTHILASFLIPKLEYFIATNLTLTNASRSPLTPA